MRRRLFLFVNFSCLALIVAGCSLASKQRRYAEAGERDYKAGQYDKARIEYMNLLRVDPKNANAYARLGAIWMDDGAPLRAGAFLTKALELAPDDSDTRSRLARVYLAVGRAGEARKEALTLLQKAPDNGEALVVLVDASQKPEEIAEARQLIEKFAQKNSSYFYMANAALAAKTKNAAEVESALKGAVAADPNSSVAHMALGNWYRSKREFAKAGAEFERAATGAPLRSPETQAIAEFKVQMGALDEANSLLTKVSKQAPDFLPAWSLQARIANRQKKYDDALRLIENVLSRDANNIEARAVQAESWLGKNETKKALDSLASLDITYPQTPMIKYALARAYLQSNNSKQAMTELDEVVRLSPNFAEAVLLQAQMRLRSGEAQSVLEPLQRLLKSVPDFAPAAVLLAEAYRALGRLDEAAAIIQQQIKSSPRNAGYYAMLGLVLRQQNKIDDARKTFERAVELDPSNAPAIGQLVDLDIAAKAFARAHERVQQLRDKQPDSDVAYYLEGKLDAVEGRFDLAQNALLKAIELNANNNEAYDLLFVVYSRANNSSEALKSLSATLAKRPQDPRALLLSGLIYDQLKDVNNARAAYEKVLSVTPDSVPALNNLAYIYAEKLNDLNKAAELAQKARSLAPTDAAVLDTLGWILYRQGKYQEAVDTLGQSAARTPDTAEIQFHLGMANYMMGRSDAARTALETALASKGNFPGKDEAQHYLAILQSKVEASAADLEAALKQQPNDPLGLLRLGEAYEREGAADKAAEAYERALRANPQLGTAALKLAQLNAGPLKDPDKALQFAKKARELAPGDPKAAATVGSIALQLKNTSWAYSLLQESARQLPNDPAVLHDLAWAAYALGRVTEAQEAMQRALEAKPDAKVSQDAQKFLATLKLGTGDKELPRVEGEVLKVLAEDPDYMPALIAKAGIQAANGDGKAAAATYSAILQRWPDFAPAQRDLAALLIEDPQNIGLANDLASKARRTLPDDPKVAMVLARASYERKEFNRAIQFLDRMQKPLDPLSLYYLGMSHAQAKQTAQARQELSQSLEAGLREPQAAEAKQTLATMANQ
jgi:tetratricopeptide (TPR) repeat protein